MAEATKIEWADSTFNPWIGCTKVSPACDHCYAENLMDTRLKRVQWGAGKPRKLTSQANWNKPLQWNKDPFYQCTGCGFRGDKTSAAARFDSSKPYFCVRCGGEYKMDRRRVFCASLADVFDNEVPDEWRHNLWRLIHQTPNLDWLLLTKRIGIAKQPEIYRYLSWPPNEMTDGLRDVLDRARRLHGRSGAVAAFLKPETAIIHSKKLQPYRYAGIRSSWVRACRRAGVEGVRIHDIRRTAITMAKQAGRDPQAFSLHKTAAQAAEYVVEVPRVRPLEVIR